MGDVIQHDMNHYSLTFYAKGTPQGYAPMASPAPKPQMMRQPSLPPASGPLAVTRLRVGKKDNVTRFVMDLTRQTKFVVKENSDFTKVYVTPAEFTKWNPALSSNQQFGVFKGYRIVNQNGDIAIELSIEKGTRVRKAQLLGVQSGHPKLVIDLQSKEMKSAHTSPHASAAASNAKNSATTSKEMPVKSFNILRQNNDTIVRLATSKVENFDVKENTVTNEVTITLPKIDWGDVDVLSEKGGLINSFRVDQSDNKKTSLILNVQKTTRVVGKKGFGRKDLARFVVYLNQGDNKSPPWLVDASADDLPYDDLEKEEGEVSSVVYRGGIRPYTTIGTGFYVGAKGSSVSGENKTHTDVNATYTTDLFSNNFGGAAHVFAGYGINFGKLYGGVEADFGIYGVDDKTSFNNGTFYNSSSDIKYMWGVSGRVGYYITPTSLLYGRFGAVSGAFQYNGSSTSDGEIIFPNNYRRDRRAGFLYGVGLESALNDMFTVRIEGAQINFQTFRTQQGTNSKKERFMLNQISMGGSYKFSPMAGPSVAGVFEESVGSGFYFGLSGGISTLTNHRKMYGLTGATGTIYDGQGSALDPSWSIIAGWSEHGDRFFFSDHPT
ncbi:MAG: porin family protein [Holosporaceae bacterium]|nr:MAG: porin family protein [Holosporaceae bacterium]